MRNCTETYNQRGSLWLQSFDYVHNQSAGNSCRRPPCVFVVGAYRNHQALVGGPALTNRSVSRAELIARTQAIT